MFNRGQLSLRMIYGYGTIIIAPGRVREKNKKETGFRIETTPLNSTQLNSTQLNSTQPAWQRAGFTLFSASLKHTLKHNNSTKRSISISISI